MIERAPATLAGVLAVAGFLVVTAWSTARAEEEAFAPRKEELLELIRDRQELVDELDAAVTELRAEVDVGQEQVGRRSRLGESLAAERTELASQAGTAALRGPGLVVTLDNSDRTPQDPAEAGAYRIHDRDLQLVVNALFGAGAEAVAVNESRLVATSPIRSAGDTILVNFRPQSPPFAIRAIGADAERFAASQIARRFSRWVQLFGLGFEVREEADLDVPAFTGRVRLGVAQPVAGEGR